MWSISTILVKPDIPRLVIHEDEQLQIQATNVFMSLKKFAEVGVPLWFILTRPDKEPTTKLHFFPRVCQLNEDFVVDETYIDEADLRGEYGLGFLGEWTRVNCFDYSRNKPAKFCRGAFIDNVLVRAYIHEESKRRKIIDLTTQKYLEMEDEMDDETDEDYEYEQDCDDDEFIILD